MKSNVILEIENLNFILDKINILKNINLKIFQGEYVSIVGANGSGKSSLAFLMSGLIDDNSDSIKRNKKIGVILENPDNQIVGTTVEEDIAFGLQNQQFGRKTIQKKIDDILNKLNMYHLKFRDVSSLSGGEKQKLALASLLVLNYDVYIFDEATSMLDPESKEMILNLMHEMWESGKTIIQITHFIDEAKLTNRVIVINDGEISYDGKPSEIMNDDNFLKRNRLL